MILKRIHLKDEFPFLGENERDPILDVYLPDNISEMGRGDMKHPNMIVCPGGGYGMCSQREAEPIALQFLPEGFNVFLLWYSVAPNRFPVQLREVAAVNELISKYAEEWHCDTSKTAIIGFSAGGHLAAHYSTAYDCAEVRAAFPESKPVQASILSYPVISADVSVAHIGSFKNLLGKQTLTAEDEDKFSCDRLVSDKTPPAFLWHTANDATVPMPNSLLYANALWKHNIPAELHVYPDGPHGLATSDGYTNGELGDMTKRTHRWLTDVKEWLKLTLK